MKFQYCNFKNCISIFLFSLILLLPYKFSIIKIGLVFIYYLFNDIFSACDKKKYVNWFLLYFSFNLFYFLYGALRGNKVSYYFRVDLFYLWLFLLLFFSIKKKEELFLLMITMKYCSLFIYIMGIIASILFNLFGYEKFLSFQASLRIGFPITAITSPLIINCIFIFPFFCTIFLLSDKNQKKLFDKVYICAGIVFIILTSRRAIYINLLMIIPLLIFLSIFLPRKEKKKISKIAFNAFIVIIIFILILLLLNNKYKIIDLKKIGEFLSTLNFFTKIEDTTGIRGGDFLRNKQKEALINGWKENFLFGTGTAANASIVRSDIPGTYELTYLALLFHTGIIGIFIYILLMLFIITNFLRLIIKNQNKYLIAYFIGFCCFMFSNGTNPYLGAFDHMWILFGCLILIKIEAKELKNDTYYDGHL